MEMKESSDGWSVSLKDYRLQHLAIDFRLQLTVSNGSDTIQVIIETPARLLSAESSVVLNPGVTSTLAPILAAVNSSVDRITIRRTGHLEIELGGGCRLDVDPHPSYEAWQLMSAGTMFVCVPGGGVSLFRKPSNT
jgi:hypothetical protein